MILLCGHPAAANAFALIEGHPECERRGRTRATRRGADSPGPSTTLTITTREDRPLDAVPTSSAKVLSLQIVTIRRKTLVGGTSKKGNPLRTATF